MSNKKISRRRHNFQISLNSLFHFLCPLSLQENPLLHNVHEGIIISNMSLVLQDVKRHQSGIYTCVAHNIEGDGVSNPMTLNIRCKILQRKKHHRLNNCLSFCRQALL